MLLKQKNPHGGDIYSNAVRYDFSANINPAGMPEEVKEAVISAADALSAYPDAYARELRAGVAERENVPEDCVLLGNGAAEMIYCFAYSLPKDREALIVSPTFSEYGTALKAAGIRTKQYLLPEERGFRLTEDFLQTDFSRYSAVFLCSPNNPTGLIVEPALLERILRTGVRLFLDLCFIDLTDTPALYNVPALLGEFPNLTVLKAFTKDFAMAGIRLGYALSGDTDFLETMAEKTQCWNVSTVAQKAGLAALRCEDWLRASVREISKERARLMRALTDLGIRVFPGRANYLLLYSEYDLPGALLKRGILVRDCSNYAGLRKGYVRIAVRTREENDALLEALKEIGGNA